VPQAHATRRHLATNRRPFRSRPVSSAALSACNWSRNAAAVAGRFRSIAFIKIPISSQMPETLGMADDALLLAGLSPVAGKAVHVAFDGGRMDLSCVGLPTRVLELDRCRQVAHDSGQSVGRIE